MSLLWKNLVRAPRGFLSALRAKAESELFLSIIWFINNKVIEIENVQILRLDHN